MKTVTTSPSCFGYRSQATRGSVLITALIFAIIVGISLLSYVNLSMTSLRFSQRTFFADAANNLAEAGTETAVWSFNKLGNNTDSVSIAAAWQDWTLGNTVADIYVDYAGDGYTSTPTVTITGGGGTGATATVSTVNWETINSITGVVTQHKGVGNVTITNAGAGYTSSPTVTITGGGGSGAVVKARLAATRTFNFPMDFRDQNATGSVKVWVAGYDGSATVPLIVTKATITPVNGAPIEKIIKIILSKNGVLKKGEVAKNGIDENGWPVSDSFISSVTPGVPPFAAYSAGGSRLNTTVASMGGTIDLGAQGVVKGNVMTGPGVNVTGSGTITGSTIGNFTYDFTMPIYPSGGSTLASLPAVLPILKPVTSGTLLRAANATTGEPDLYDMTSGAAVPYTEGAAPAGYVAPVLDPSDGKYYYTYRVSNVEIGALKIRPGTNVIIVGNNNTRIRAGLQIPASEAHPAVGPYPAEAAKVGSLKVYMDGNIDLSGNDTINKVASPNTSWAGALEVYTTTTLDCSFGGNAEFVGTIFAPYSRLDCNGGGSDHVDLSGSFVVGSIKVNGHVDMHFDEGLNAATNPKPWKLALWTEMQTAAERQFYASKFNF